MTTDPYPYYLQQIRSFMPPTGSDHELGDACARRLGNSDQQQVCLSLFAGGRKRRYSPGSNEIGGGKDGGTGKDT